VAILGFRQLMISSGENGGNARDSTKRNVTSSDNGGRMRIGGRTMNCKCGFYEFAKGHTTGPGIHKWMHYWEIYEEHFKKYCLSCSGRTVRFMEVGIQSGGSMLMWRHVFGPNLLQLVGVDINAATKAWEKFGKNVQVEIGSQEDEAFLRNLARHHTDGFDVILDDGSHRPVHQFLTFTILWPLVRPGGVYMIEDIHGNNPIVEWIRKGHKQTSAVWPGLVGPKPDNPNAYRANATSERGFLNYYLKARFKPSAIQSEVDSIQEYPYPYMLAITRREKPITSIQAAKFGNKWIPYKWIPKKSDNHG